MLARTLRRLYGSETLLLMKNYPEAIDHARRSGQQVVPLVDRLAETQQLLQLCRQFQPDWLIVDLPYADADTSYFPRLQQQGTKILFIDEFRFVDPAPDVLLNSNILAPKRQPRSSSGRTRYFLGPEYFIFEASLFEAPPAEPSGRYTVTLTFGGSDPTDLTGNVVRTLLTRHWPGVLFQVVLGPGYPNVEHIEKLISTRDDTFRLLVNPPNIVPYFKASDLVISAGGRTLYELLYLAIPAFPIATTANEAEVIAEFVDQGFVRYGLTAWEPELFLERLDRLVRPRSGADAVVRQGGCEADHLAGAFAIQDFETGR